jgi:CxxC motif-containing protein (DUF1111 family)
MPRCVRLAIFTSIVGLLSISGAPRLANSQPAATTPAATGFDDAPNGFHTTPVGSEREHAEDKKAFDEVETAEQGLGPVYNAQSCRECHQNPISGGPSQTLVKRAVIRAAGTILDPDITLEDGKMIFKRNLINDRAICPQEQERVPDVDGIYTTNRLSLNILGDGFVEAVPDDQLIAIARNQCQNETADGICGEYLYVPVLEADGVNRVGRFGWKNQHASLLSFSADAYFNEMGITSDLFPQDVISGGGCDKVADPEDKPERGMRDIDRFARFMRATKAPAPRGNIDFDRPETIPRGFEVFKRVGCAKCHVDTLTTAPPGTKLNGGLFQLDENLGNKRFHPFSDFLLHDIGTGDGVPVSVEEHFGLSRPLRGRLDALLRTMHRTPQNSFRTIDTAINERGGKKVPPRQRFSMEKVQRAANKLRTAPLWGLRTHARLMHDGMSFTNADAIARHRGEAEKVRARYDALPLEDKKALIDFLLSL